MAGGSRHFADCSGDCDKKQKEIGKRAAFGRLILPESGPLLSQLRDIHASHIATHPPVLVIICNGNVINGSVQ